MADKILYGVQLHPCGQICYFKAAEWPDLNCGSKVVVRVDKGEAIAEIVKILSGNDIPTPALQDEPITSANAASQELDTANSKTDTEHNAVNGKNQNVESENSAEITEKPIDKQVAPVKNNTVFAGEVYEWEGWEENGNLAENMEANEEQGPSLCMDPSSTGIQPILRPATDEDLANAAKNKSAGDHARKFCMQRARHHKLDMKLVMADYLLDGSKIIFYFTAPNRIDFRELVKDLVKEFHTRIELRQIGVRHETQMIGATGNCGMVCCCRRYIRNFAPVTIKMAKEQNLFLNPAKISGTCGRLLCCLAFEQEGYEDFHNRCPKMGKKYTTNRGVVKVLRSSIFRSTLFLLPEEGDEFEVSLEEWQSMEPARQGQPQNQPGQGKQNQNRNTRGQNDKKNKPRDQARNQDNAEAPIASEKKRDTNRENQHEQPDKAEAADKKSMPGPEPKPDHDQELKLEDAQQKDKLAPPQQDTIKSGGLFRFLATTDGDED